MFNVSSRQVSSPFLQEVRRTAVLAAPVVLSQLAQVSLGFIDTVMVGRLGEESLAAVGLGAATFFPLLVICMGIIHAVGPMVSQAYGAERLEDAGRAVRQGLLLAVVLTVPAFFLLWNSGTMMAAFGQSPAVVERAQTYLRAMAFGFMPALGFVALRNLVEGFSRPRPVLYVAVLGVLCNIAADYVFIFGEFGFPALGVVGAGWASATVYWSMFLLLGVYISLSRRFARCTVFRSMLRPDPPTLRELLHIGLPTGALWGIEAGLFATTAFLIGTLGSTTLAAHQIAIQCASVTFMVPVGVSIAASVRVGQAVGRGDLSAARLAGFTGMLIGTGFMAITALSFWTFPRQIVSLYIDVSLPANQGVVESAVGLLGIAAFFQVFDGMQATAGGALRGMKDTRIPMLVGLISYWLIGLTSGYVFAFPLGGGGKGLWWGLVLGLAFAAVLLGLRFHRLMPAPRGTPARSAPDPALAQDSGDDQHIIQGVGPRSDSESPQEKYSV